MKKKILSVLLAVLTIFSLAVPAFAGNIIGDFYYIWINNIQVTEANHKDVLKDGGSVKFDPETYTLTLTDAKITATGLRNSGITIGTTLDDPVKKVNIELVGESFVYGNTNPQTKTVCAGLNCYSCDEVNFCGDGKITFTGYDNGTYTAAGIYGNNTTKINVEDGTVKVVGKGFKYYQFTDKCSVRETSNGFTVTRKTTIVTLFEDFLEAIGNFFLSIGNFFKNLF